MRTSVTRGFTDVTLDNSLRYQQFGIQHGRTCRAAYSVVTETDELIVENGVGEDAADGDGHAVAVIAVKACLRPRRLVGNLDELLR